MTPKLSQGKRHNNGQLLAVDGRPRPSMSKTDLAIARWVQRAYSSWRSWRTVARMLSISSPGQAQRIAAGQARPHPDLVARYEQLLVYRSAGRWLSARTPPPQTP